MRRLCAPLEWMPFLMVIGMNWATIEARELAKEKRMEWMVDNMPSEGLMEFRRLPFEE